jgi:L-fuconate dehydratase
MTRITDIIIRDVRFPTSRTLDGSDAMHPDPDYSAAYVTLVTNGPENGDGFAFTIGRGTEIIITAIEALTDHVVGRTLEEITQNMRGFYRSLTNDTQVRWIGPEKGAVHMAVAALMNAVWDLWARVEGKPLWKLIVDMTPEELIGCLDFTYVTDELSEEDALEWLRSKATGRTDRENLLLKEGIPAYTTSAGWMGYDDERILLLSRAAVAEGFTHVKMKVGSNLEDDLRRGRLIRSVIGHERKLMIDANQRWDVGQAIAWTNALAELDPWWIEEPTSPDDALGHAAIRRGVAPIGVATGEHAQNRVIFKQMLQAEALDFCQIDACRLGGVNEVIIVLLMAARRGIPVCPHAGGVGLCELVQHLAAINFIAIAGNWDNVVVEFVDHLHEHFVSPCVVENGRYRAPLEPGYSATIKDASLTAFGFPDGDEWTHPRPVA